MTKKYFGTDGIRGAINSKHINGDMFFKFGLASGTYFRSQKKIKQTAIIAKDTRLSGYTLEPCTCFRISFSWNACLYIWPYANKWFGNAN
jgi:phosphomannomutase